MNHYFSHDVYIITSTILPSHHEWPCNQSKANLTEHEAPGNYVFNKLFFIPGTYSHIIDISRSGSTIINIACTLRIIHVCNNSWADVNL